MRHRSILATLGLLACAFGSSCSKRAPAPPVEILVAGAASLRGVLPEIEASYERAHTGERVTATFGSSGELRQQVQGGAPVDVVAFAGGEPVDDLIAHGLVDASSRHVIATNSLVLIGPKGCPRVTFSQLSRVPKDEKIAIGDPRSVPAGQYAKAALERLHQWEIVQPQLVYGSDVSAVLAYARRGEVAAAVVYKTELHGVSGVDLLDELPGGADARPEVVVGLVTGSHAKSAAVSFLAYLEGPEAEKVLTVYGFGPP